MMDRQRVPGGWSDRALGTGARWRTLILVAVIVLVQPGTALAQRWYEEYDDGLNAIDAQGWLLAVERLDAALEKRPDQSRDPIRWYGTIYKPYIPEFYLAVAYLNLNRSQEAVDLLENVQRDGLVVEGDDQFPRFTNVLGDARRRVAAEAARAEAARAEAARVAEAAEVSEQLERSALLAFYTGDYEGARAGLDRLISEAPTARAYLFLASSQVAAGLLGSEDQAVWLTPAAEDYQRAVREGVDPEMYREFISPRILQLLRDAGTR